MSRHKKAKSAQAFLLQKSILAAPCKGLAYGPQAARRTGGQANLRFASAASPPGLRPAPPSAQACPTGGKDSVKENRQGCLSRFIRAGAFKSAKRYALPPAPKKNAPGPNAPTRPTGGKDSVKENRQGCLSRLIRAGAFKSAKRYALPPAPAKKTPFGVFFAGAADGN